MAAILAVQAILFDSSVAPFPFDRGWSCSLRRDRLTSGDCHHTMGEWMIQSFKHRGLKRLYEKGDTRGVGTDLLSTVQNILTVLDAATSPPHHDRSISLAIDCTR
jgi:hypothetical protein